MTIVSVPNLIVRIGVTIELLIIMEWQILLFKILIDWRVEI